MLIGIGIKRYRTKILTRIVASLLAILAHLVADNAADCRTANGS